MDVDDIPANAETRVLVRNPRRDDEEEEEEEDSFFFWIEVFGKDHP